MRGRNKEKSIGTRSRKEGRGDFAQMLQNIFSHQHFFVALCNTTNITQTILKSMSDGKKLYSRWQKKPFFFKNYRFCNQPLTKFQFLIFMKQVQTSIDIFRTDAHSTNTIITIYWLAKGSFFTFRKMNYPKYLKYGLFWVLEVPWRNGVEAS